MYIKMNSRQECCCTSCLNTDLAAVLQTHLRCCTSSSSLSSCHLCNCFHYSEGEENPFCVDVAMNQSHQATSQFRNLSWWFCSKDLFFCSTSDKPLTHNERPVPWEQSCLTIFISFKSFEQQRQSYSTKTLVHVGSQILTKQTECRVAANIKTS